MIGRLSGLVAFRGTDQVLIDVRGVGYVVHVSTRTLAGLAPVGQAAALWTELLVREDLLQLYGFETLAEREWYRLLTSVQGVGSKAAMAILGTLSPDALSRAIALGDASSVRAAPGVGPKIAQRVVMELKDKAPGVMAMGASPAPADPLIEPVAASQPPASDASPARAPVAPATTAAVTAEALSALVNLGYGQGEAAAAIAEATAEPGLTTPALIRAALKLLAPKG